EDGNLLRLRLCGNLLVAARNQVGAAPRPDAARPGSRPVDRDRRHALPRRGGADLERSVAAVRRGDAVGHDAVAALDRAQESARPRLLARRRASRRGTRGMVAPPDAPAVRPRGRARRRPSRPALPRRGRRGDLVGLATHGRMHVVDSLWIVDASWLVTWREARLEHGIALLTCVAAAGVFPVVLLVPALGRSIRGSAIAVVAGALGLGAAHVVPSIWRQAPAAVPV